ncbi:hypothetical protein CPB83DRAFT_848313 [Crepidotus variabilis]|uniref:Thc1 RRM domain-containing protein n=1 Tax=Crepidotus variabilis TaxID=179855 RepID=A0A9P6JTT0_9AGAR|nr:hypothetical protein CPB83DRAFT_848313 [Crepidotus variabilis]
MAAALSGLSACVTRILYLTGFPKELKTKDIQSAFADYDNVAGGFKIKWRDDTSLLIVFQDANVAKRAYLTTLAFPPKVLTSASGVAATIKPYDGPDAQSVIQTVNSRGQHHTTASRSHQPRAASVSVFPNTRTASGSIAIPNALRNGFGGAPGSQHVALPERQEGREPSPTLPSLPSHPTLDALINSSLPHSNILPTDPAILSSSMQHHQAQHEVSGGPRIGDPGKRMLGAALGVRHPGLSQRMVSGGSSPGNGMEHVQRAMGGLIVAE